MTALSDLISVLDAVGAESIHVCRAGSVRLVTITTLDRASLAALAIRLGAPAPINASDADGNWHSTMLATTECTVWMHSRPVARKTA